MKKISRSGFLKLAAAAAMSGVTAGALTACGNSASSSSAAASSAAVYTPGTYTAKATGMGEVTVSMTFTENAINESGRSAVPILILQLRCGIRDILG